MNTSLRQEFSIYNEILHGYLQPLKPQLNDPELLSRLIEYANTRKVEIRKAFKHHDEIFTKINYTKLGYKQSDDFIILKANMDSNGVLTITIIPSKYYVLGDKMDNDIEKPPCIKSKSYLQLIVDEFERIKIRAFNLLNTTEDPEHLKLRSLKNLRIAEYLLRESSAYAQYLQTHKNENKNQSLFYIYDCLKKFLIKSIRFYHRLFDPFITKFYAQSEKLINNIDRSTSADCIKYIDQDNIENFLEEPLPEINKESVQDRALPKLRWNGKINSLATLFYDLLEKKMLTTNRHNVKVSNDENLAGTDMDLVEFLYNNFLDSNGDRLSKDTLRTYLNPGRPDKRSKRSKDLNIDKYM